MQPLAMMTFADSRSILDPTLARGLIDIWEPLHHIQRHLIFHSLAWLENRSSVGLGLKLPGPPERRGCSFRFGVAQPLPLLRKSELRMVGVDHEAN